MSLVSQIAKLLETRSYTINWIAATFGLDPDEVLNVLKANSQLFVNLNGEWGLVPNTPIPINGPQLTVSYFDEYERGTKPLPSLRKRTVQVSSLVVNPLSREEFETMWEQE